MTNDSYMRTAELTVCRKLLLVLCNRADREVRCDVIAGSKLNVVSTAEIKLEGLDCTTNFSRYSAKIPCIKAKRTSPQR